MVSCFRSDIVQESFNDMLCEQAAQYANRTALTFLSGDGTVEAEWTFMELDRRARAVGRLLEANDARGKRVLLLFPPGLEYVAAFFGALYAGAVAVPAYPPRYNQRLERLRAIAADAQAKLAITVPQVFSRIDASLGHAPEMKSLQWLTVGDELETDETWQPVEANADDLAFLQYTSGSTAQPRGVMVTHGNLLHNERMIQQAFDQTEKDIVVSWLPPYHDMGLIGTILQPLFTGSRAVLMSPASFLQRPVLWLETISRYGATTSGGPNFAYELCVNKSSEEQCAGLDLSTWRVAFNGAEPVRAATLDRFAKAFRAFGFCREAFQPCYGLAEATLLVSGQRRSSVPTIKQFDAQKLESHRVAQPAQEEQTAKSLVGCGTGISEQEFVIVDPETSTRCAPGAIGEVWIAGPSVAHGYWNRPLETERTFEAHLNDDVRGPFLRTGDLGFLCDGELFITGRLKDLLIIRGRNLYPHDIEETVRQSHPALTSGGCAVFSIETPEEEQVVVVQEVKPRAGLNLEKVIDGIRQAVSMSHEVELHAVLLTIPKALPKTSSGKIQRYLCRAKYLNDEFKVVARWEGDAYTEQSAPQTMPVDPSSVESITKWLVQQLAGCLRVDVKQVDPRRPVSSYGIDSLRATELTHNIETALGVELSLATVLEGPPPIDLARLLYIKLTTAPGTSKPIVQAVLGNKGPLSSGQRALWFMQQLAPASAAYNLAGAIVIREKVDVAALRRAFQAVTETHAILRTRFTETAGQIEQHVSERAECNFVVRNAAKLDLDEEIAAEAQRPFDLRRDYALRAVLYQRGAGEDVLLIVVHHIAVDLWSLGIVIQDIGQAYQAAKTSRALKLEAPSLRYLDYVNWQSEFLSGVEGEEHWAYWQKQLAGELPIVDLPSAGPRPPVKTFAGAVKVVRINAELTKSLKKLSEANQATLFVTLLAAFHALLYRYTGQDDLITGTTTSGRTHASFSGVVGYFVNPLVIRSRVHGKQSFETFLASMKETVLEALAHKEFPFPLLVERLQPERNAGRSPVFDVAFAFQNAPRSKESGLVSIALGEAGVAIDLNGMPVETLAVERRSAQFDLTLMMAEVDDALTAAFEYNTDLFDATTIDRISRHFQNLLAAIVRTPEEQIARLPLLDEQEVQQQLTAWNETAAEYPYELCLHELVEASVERTPDAVAMSCGSEALTYEELNRRADDLAGYLRSRGVGCEDRVALLLERSPQLLVAILGVLKSGAAYVPLDAAYPAQRLQWMMADAGVKLLLSEREVAERVFGDHQIDVVYLSEIGISTQRRKGAKKIQNPPLRLCAFAFQTLPENAAYVIYTSGSTGVPKASIITHTAAVNFSVAMTNELGLTPTDRILQFASPSFDVFVEEVFPAWAAGAAVVMMDSEEAASAAESRGLTEVISRNEVTGCELPTAFWHQWSLELTERPASLRFLMIGCDKPSPAWLADWERFNIPLTIVFGLTETTITSTLQKYFVDDTSEHNFDPPSVGRPVANTQTYIVDGNLHPPPIGVAGELYVGGTGLARGYFNRPSITAERFIPNPFSALSGDRLYRTGDLARYLADGRIEFLGRADEQVKIRGFRVEPVEIEIALSAHASVRECSVCVREDVPGEKRLVAYIVCNDGPTPTASDLRQHLKARLPEYMLPSAYVMLDELPVTPNGKIDRKALPRPDESRPQLDQTYVAPRTQVEELLAGLWSEVLRVNQVGIEDNFFELGGHSLLATKLNSRISKTFNIELPLRTIFELPTIAQFAPQVEHALSKTESALFLPLKPVPRDTPPPLSFAQGRLWFLDQLEPGNPFYNISTGVRVKGSLDLAALERTLTDIRRRHEGLRTIFPVYEGAPVQVILPPEPFKLQKTDLSRFSGAELIAEVNRVSREEAERPFDLSQGPLLRVLLLELRPDDHIVLLSMHHIIADEWSMEMLSQEIGALYTAYTNNEPSPLEELPIQYADYACWQRAQAETPLFEQQLDYWRAQLAGAPQLLSLPTDRPRPPIQTFRGANFSFRLSAELSEKLRELSRRESVTLFMLLLATFKVLLYRYTGQRDIVVGTDISGRERKELEGLIGFFVNQLVLRTQLEATWSFTQLVQTVREVCLAAYGHQEVPFDRVVEEMNVERSLSYGPLFQVSFTLSNVQSTPLNLPGLAVGSAGGAIDITRYDLTLMMVNSSDIIAGEFEYNTDLFDATTIDRISRHFQNLLAAIVRTPEEQIARLPLLDEQEVKQQLTAWNDTAAEYPYELCLHKLVEASVERTPDAVAVRCGSEAVTYEELNRRADDLAGYLRSRGVGCEDRVALLLERSPQLIAAILGVLKSGAAYVPLDAAYPAQRLQWMMADADVKLLLSECEVAERVFGTDFSSPRRNGAAEIEMLPLRLCAFAFEKLQSNSAVRSGVTSANAAYVIYTSGSTGVPKASIITHTAAVNFTVAMTNELALTPTDRILQFASPSFDVFVEEVFPAWTAGAAVVLMDTAEAAAAAESRGLTEVINRNEVTGCELPTAYWHQWSLELEKQGVPDSLRFVIIGGENALRERVEAWRRFDIPLINAYGLTEVAVTSIVYTLDHELNQWAEFPIGRPISNTDVYILDARMQPVPAGVIGDLYVGGTGLGRGYHNRADLTAEKFIPHPFSDRPGERLYYTGDLARYLPDSKIENIGRRDFQVKIRGFRIELGEIEAALAQYAGVRECVVVADDTHAGNRRLVAYIAAGIEDRPTPAELRAYLTNKLPDYMVPSAFVFMEALPLTPNGKVDRKSLPAISDSRPELGHEYVAPETPTERELFNLWSTILGLQTIGVHDNFFEVGGHSLLATQLVSHIRETFNIELPLRAIFEAPTISGLAETIDALRPEQQAVEQDLARLLESLESLSDEDARALLQEKLEVA